MRELDLTDIQAAGLLGNLGHETGGFAHLQEVSPSVPGSPGGWGIAQWTGPRRRAMEAWCHAQGLDPASEAANEGYLCAELSTGEARALLALRHARTLEQATEVFCRLFERPGIVALPDRLVWARRALGAIRSILPAPAGDPPAPAGPAQPRPHRAAHPFTPARRSP